MIAYKNISNSPKTFYGVTFNPNDIKEVPGYINHINMIRVFKQSRPTVKAIISPEETVTKVVGDNFADTNKTRGRKSKNTEEIIKQEELNNGSDNS